MILSTETLIPDSSKKSLIESLSSAFTADRLIDEIRLLLKAEVVTKCGITLPDNRTRLAAVQLLFSYLEGRPVERIITKSTSQVIDPDADLSSRLKKSPALRRMMRRLLTEAE